MNNDKSILPGIGLGNVKFGSTREEVKTILGEPDEIEYSETSCDDNSRIETWHYDELELSAEFDEEENWELVALGVSSGDFELNSKPLIGLKMEKLIDTLNDMDVLDLELEDLPTEDSPSSQLISSEKISVDFWLEDGKLREIQWGVWLTDNGFIEWPD